MTEEVVQEAFMNVWRRASSFDSRRGRCSAWLLSLVRHRAIDVLRQARRLPVLFLDGGFEFGSRSSLRWIDTPRSSADGQQDLSEA